MRMTEAERLRDDLIKHHWMFNYTWRGVTLDYLERGYPNVPRAEILSMMRDIAKEHDPPDVSKLPNSRCKSCGMRIFWGKLNGGNHPFDPKVLTIGTADGTLVQGRESHFVSCPNAEKHRSS